MAPLIHITQAPLRLLPTSYANQSPLDILFPSNHTTFIIVYECCDLTKKVYLISLPLPLKICKFQHVDGYKKTCQQLAADWTRKIKSIWFFGGRQVTPLLSCNILSNNKLFILPLCISKEYTACEKDCKKYPKICRRPL